MEQEIETVNLNNMRLHPEDRVNIEKKLREISIGMSLLNESDPMEYQKRNHIRLMIRQRGESILRFLNRNKTYQDKYRVFIDKICRVCDIDYHSFLQNYNDAGEFEDYKFIKF